MFSIFLIIAGFQVGVPFLAIFIVVFFWTCVLCCNFSKTNKKKYNNPIDKHGDKNYGNIDWLYDGKL